MFSAGEHCLDPDTHLLDLYNSNHGGEWVIKLKPNASRGLWRMDGQIGEQLAKEGQSQSLKKDQIHAALPSLSFSSLEQQARRRQMEETETDRWRICQEQSLKTVYDQMNTHCPLSLSLYLSLSLHLSSFSLFTPSFLSFVAPGLRRYGQKSCWRDSLLPTENLLHREREESERLGSSVCHLFSQAVISNHERADGDAEHLWL